MRTRPFSVHRRRFLSGAAAFAAGLSVAAAAGRSARAGRPGTPAHASDERLRPIPSSGERVPAVGMGTWITFNVGRDPVLRDARAEVLRSFFDAGGGMIDSSPMYGSAQAVLGYGLGKLGSPGSLFSADKVWTRAGSAGPAQIEESRRNWGIPRFDLMQVHNLLAWEEHLATLAAMKAEGTVRYIGITTSHGRRHDLFERVMGLAPLDFVQFTYNALDREAEARLLPLAAERGIAVIANRPFRRGALTDRLSRHPLPGWAAEIGCTSWAQVLLKFIIAHPAVTCAIPATSRVDHVRENMAAASGPLPDARLRERISADIASL